MTDDTTVPTRVPGIEAVLFDAFGTLFDVHSAAGALAEALGPQASDMSALWRQKQVQYTWLRSLMGVYAPFATVTADALDHALAACGQETPGLRARLLDRYGQLDAYPEVPAALRRIKTAGIATGILSNGEAQATRALARHAGVLDSLDHVLSADTVKVFKPDARVYRLGPQATGQPPERLAFVSSNAWDVAGAAHFGFQVIWVNRFGQVPEQLPGTPRAVVADLWGVAAALEASA